jgi:hypothetical protein
VGNAVVPAIRKAARRLVIEIMAGKDNRPMIEVMEIYCWLKRDDCNQICCQNLLKPKYKNRIVLVPNIIV